MLELDNAIVIESCDPVIKAIALTVDYFSWALLLVAGCGRDPDPIRDLVGVLTIDAAAQGVEDGQALSDEAGGDLAQPVSPL